MKNSNDLQKNAPVSFLKYRQVPGKKETPGQVLSCEFLQILSEQGFYSTPFLLKEVIYTPSRTTGWTGHPKTTVNIRNELSIMRAVASTGQCLILSCQRRCSGVFNFEQISLVILVFLLLTFLIGIYYYLNTKSKGMLLKKQVRY